MTLNEAYKKSLMQDVDDFVSNSNTYNTLKTIQQYLDDAMKAKRDQAKVYIEMHIDELDSDLQKFFDNCPVDLFNDVRDQLILAEIDLSGVDFFTYEKHKYEHLINNGYITNSKGVYIHDGGTYNTLSWAYQAQDLPQGFIRMEY